MLTIEQRAFLAKPFTLNEHGFVNGNVYLKKSAIRRRLSLVGPWSLSQPTLISATERLVVMSASLTLGDESRAGVGTGVVITTSTDKSTGEILPLSDDMIARNTGKAFKTAASDTLPRAARLFGVGDYLKDAGKIKTESDLKKLLDTLAPGAAAATPPAMPAPTLPIPATGGTANSLPASGEGRGGVIDPQLDKADIDQVDALCQKHLDATLVEFLGRSGDYNAYADFIRRYTTLDEAQKAIATRIVDNEIPVRCFAAETATSRAGSLYISVSFGFNTVAVFDKDVDKVFKETPYFVAPWRIPGQQHDFKPPVLITMRRDLKGFPHIDTIQMMEVEAAS